MDRMDINDEPRMFRMEIRFKKRLPEEAFFRQPSLHFKEIS